MNYYIVNAETDQIIDQVSRMDDEKAQKEADYYGCPIYVIQGEHAGYTAEPQNVVNRVNPLDEDVAPDDPELRAFLTCHCGLGGTISPDHAHYCPRYREAQP